MPNTPLEFASYGIKAGWLGEHLRVVNPGACAASAAARDGDVVRCYIAFGRRAADSAYRMTAAQHAARPPVCRRAEVAPRSCLPQAAPGTQVLAPILHPGASVVRLRSESTKGGQAASRASAGAGPGGAAIGTASSRGCYGARMHRPGRPVPFRHAHANAVINQGGDGRAAPSCPCRRCIRRLRSPPCPPGLTRYAR